MNYRLRTKDLHPYLADTKQSYWQLTVIQLVGWMTLPILATSILILQGNSMLGAALTIIVGNAILWFVRLGIISMSFKKRQSTLDISREYLGEIGGYFIAVLLLVSTFSWFIVQTTAASKTLSALISVRENLDIDRFIQVSVFLGVVSTFLCMEGMVLLRRLAVFIFPFIAVSFVLILTFLPYYSYQNQNELSLSGLTLVLATNLGITSDMPTFFRHSRSWTDSIKALTIVQIATLVLGLVSLFLGAIISGLFEINEGVVFKGNGFLRYPLIVFIFTSAICTNVANVYSSSVGWELVAPRSLVGRKEYLILGLGLTIIFIIVSNIFSPVYMLHVSDCALVNLCIIFMVAYLFSKSLKKPPTSYQQKVYFVAWIISSTINTIQFTRSEDPHVSPLFLSFLAIVITVFLGHLFSMRHKK